MSDEENDIELIEAYLNGMLTGGALHDFERRRATDIAFDKDVTEYTLIMREIRLSGEEEFRGKLQKWESDIVSKEKKANVIPMWRIVSIAATLLLFAIGGAYIVTRNLPSSSDELFTQYFEPYEDVVSSRSADSSALQTGMTLYNEHQYAEAIPYLLKANEAAPDDLSIPCYIGVSYLATDDPKSARTVLEPLTRSEPGLYRELAEWNIALCHLRLHDTASVKQQLRKISDNESHMYATKAKSLLGDL